MKNKTGRKFWTALVIFSLMGQIAWVVENMYFNVFIYKIFNASASDISWMVGASAVAATLTTWLVGAFADKVGKRRIFICAGYIAWGFSILGFILMRMDVMERITGNTATAAALGVSLVILMDCIMTFFGSSANDASFNAWLTDMGNETNRGKIEGINSMMPLVAILVVFGGFMAFDLDQSSSWTMIFAVIGIAVILIGILGFFLIDEPVLDSSDNKNYWRNVTYCFRPSVFRENKLLYTVVGAFAVFGISIQIFMPYLILYYEKSLGMDNYVLIMAPAIIIAAVITAFAGRLYDLLGFETSVVPTILILMAGYVFLFFCRTTPLVFLGSLLMMTGYLTGMSMFGAMIRDHIPEEKSGLFQGLRIFGQVFVPGIIGPMIGAVVLHNAEQIVNNDGTTSFIPNNSIYLAAFAVAALLLVSLWGIFRMMHTGHRILPLQIDDSGLDSRIDTALDTASGSVHDTSTDRISDITHSQIPFNEYPRPQLRRDSFYNLNGDWMLNNNPIIVPYPPQSELSGYEHHVGGHLHYSRHFELPEDFERALSQKEAHNRVLLHFGAVDQIATVLLNGVELGRHEGGYLPFSFDITEVVNRASKGASDSANASNLLEVRVIDTLSHVYPYGKQRRNRGGMWYTPVSGIWQTVWMEVVPEREIRGLRITPELNQIHLEVDTDAEEYEVTVYMEDGNLVETFREKSICVQIQNPRFWTPESPHLYDIQIRTKTDCVKSYFALRTIKAHKKNGKYSICLNGEPYFLHGVLDQGYYSDGIFLPRSEKGFLQDILRMKELGFNTLRKHIKIEPECFYYYCDKYGMLVEQDMVNNGSYSFIRDTALPTLGQRKRNDTRGGNTRTKDFFRAHTLETVQHLYNHPCVVYYTIFNEGWGQFNSDELYGLVREADPTRIIDTTSGWFRGKKSDVVSIHIYFKTVELRNTYKPMVVSECGGYSYTIPEHSYSLYANFGYGNCISEQELTDQIVKMYEDMILPAVENGRLNGCIYTQLSDVEDETNGFYTYDRAVCKVDKARIHAISAQIQELMKQRNI